MLASLGAALTACTMGRRGTIGAILSRSSNGRTHVRDAPQHLGAHEAGLRPGDEVLFVEGRDVRTISDLQLSRLLQGPVGSKVQLTVARGPNSVLHLEVTRSAAQRYLQSASDRKE